MSPREAVSRMALFVLLRKLGMSERDAQMVAFAAPLPEGSPNG